MTGTPDNGGRGTPLLDVLTGQRTRPDGYDHWGFRAVWPDLQSSRNFRWPFPGGVAEAPGPLLDHGGECPRAVGDGLCVATTPEAMASGGIPAGTILLTAHREGDILGESDGKVRVRRALVVDVTALRAHDLRGVDLERLYAPGLHLDRADLTATIFDFADLRGVDLTFATLRRATLRLANLTAAVLHGADLRDATLTGAYLAGAYLADAHLGGADLTGADLHGADLTDAILAGARMPGWERGPDGVARKAGL